MSKKKTSGKNPDVETLDGVLKKHPIDVTCEDETGLQTTRKLVVLELTGLERGRYLTAMRKRTGGAQDISQIKNFGGIQSTLLKICVQDRDTGELVSEEDIENFPSTAQTRLYEIANDLSGFTPKKKKKKKDGSEDEEEGEA